MYVSDGQKRAARRPGDRPSVVLYCNGPFAAKQRLSEELLAAWLQQGARYYSAFRCARARLLTGSSWRPSGTSSRMRTAVLFSMRGCGKSSRRTIPGARNIPQGSGAARQGRRRGAEGKRRRPPAHEDHNTRIVVFGRDANPGARARRGDRPGAFHNVSYFAGPSTCCESAAK